MMAPRWILRIVLAGALVAALSAILSGCGRIHFQRTGSDASTEDGSMDAGAPALDGLFADATEVDGRTSGPDATDAEAADGGAADAASSDAGHLPCNSFPTIAHQPPDFWVMRDWGSSGRRQAETETLTVSGTGTPAFEINGSGEWITSGAVAPDDALRLRVRSAPTAGASREMTLELGTIRRCLRVVTCEGATCMQGVIGANVGCIQPQERVVRWRCPGSDELIHAYEFTYQFAGTGLLACPAGASCEWDVCGGNGWDVGTLACP